MVSLTFLFWMYVILFGVIGTMRGWAKEILVSFSVILALTFTTLLESYMPFLREFHTAEKVTPQQVMLLFWLRFIILLVLAFFGYQSPNLQRISAKVTREKLEHAILGAVIGAINGYLIAGSIWYYLHDAGYPFALITAPVSSTAMGDTAIKLIQYMPPHVLGVPAIYFAIVLAFIFVIVVFI